MTQVQQQRLLGALLLIILIGTSAWLLLDNVAKNHQPISAPKPIAVATPKKVIAETTTIVNPPINTDKPTAELKPSNHIDTKPVDAAPQTQKPTTVIPETKPKPIAKPVLATPEPQDPTPVIPAETKSKAQPVPVKSSEKKSNLQWFLQVASFSQKDNAATLVKKLKDIGYSATIDTSRLDSGKTLYRVRLPATEDKALLDKSAIVIKDKLNLSPQVQRYLPQ